jgi:hypothetical protein
MISLLRVLTGVLVRHDSRTAPGVVTSGRSSWEDGMPDRARGATR